MTMRRRLAGSPPSKPNPFRWLDDLRQDLRYAWRQLAHSPGIAALVAGTLAIGIGANVTMAGVIDRLLLRAPPGVREPDGLARLLFEIPGVPAPGPFVSYPLLQDFERNVSAFDGVAAYTSAKLTLGGPTGPEVSASLVSASFFSVLGVVPALGRVFTAADGFPDGAAAGGPAVAVLAHGFWQRQFGGDSSVVGRTIQVGKVTYTVVGVAPPRFRGLEPKAPDLWLPLTVAADAEKRRFILEDRSASWLSLVARVRRGVARRVAEEQATAVARRAGPPVPPYSTQRVLAASVIRGRGPDAPREVKLALWLGGVSALVLLIACANVANLLLARAFTRRREIAVRLALGAGRGRLARQMLAEGMVLAALGGGAAIAVAAACGGLVRRVFSLDGGGGFIDARALAFTATDVRGAPLVAIINEPLARLLFPGEDPIGQCIYLPDATGDAHDDCRTVVGVVHGFWYPRSILQRDGLLVYVPLAQRRASFGPPGEMTIAVSGDAPAVVPQVRAAILEVYPTLPRLTVRWMREVVEPEVRPWRLSASMFSLFGLVSLVIAAMGLYAVVAFTAAQRAPEIAVRIALGARWRHVLVAVAADGVRAVVAGLAVGVAAALGLRWWVGPLLFRTSPSDPAVMLAAAALLLGVAVVALIVPTARALRRDPAAVLRVD